MQNCPCGSSKPFTQCCDVFISGKIIPSTPEELMRSRYTAYTQANMDYIAQTMKPPANIDFDAEATGEWAKSVTWIKLEVIKSSVENKKGFVEFKADFFENQKHYLMHELSEFDLIDGRWYYIDGKQLEKLPPRTAKKIPRNDPCPCGSLKKYKKCCGSSV
ncbi:MAG: YchJ family protein [Gammaproteobacteria bacterium]